MRQGATPVRPAGPPGGAVGDRGQAEARQVTFPQLLADRARRTPHGIAMRRKRLGLWREYTWGEYYEHVRRLAAGLVELGLGPGERVAIQANNSPEWLFADLAIQMAGGVTVGIHPTSSSAEAGFIVQDSGAQYFIAGHQGHLDSILAMRQELPLLRKIILIETRGMRRHQDPMVIPFEDVERLGEKRLLKEPDWAEGVLDGQDPQKVCLFIYTSGTTGRPKAALFSASSAISTVEDLLEANPIKEDDSILSYLPLCEGMERLLSVFVPLRVGCVVNFPESTATVGDALYDIAPTVVHFLPRALESLVGSIMIGVRKADRLKRLFYETSFAIAQRKTSLELEGKGSPWWLRVCHALGGLLVFRKIKDRWGLTRARLAYCGGAPVSPEVLRFLFTLGIPVRAFYGAAEFLGVTFCQRPGAVKIGTVGRPLKGIEYELDHQGELLQRRRGHPFLGYHHGPQGQATGVRRDGWVDLGDKAYLDEDGHLVVLGRSQEIFATARGELVSPAEIENKLKFSSYVKEAVVVGEGREYLTALVQIDYTMVADWARSRGIPYTTFRSLVENPEVIALVGAEVQRVNQDLPEGKRIRGFRLFPKELEHADDELTPNYKVKRGVVERRFKDLIEEMYP